MLCYGRLWIVSYPHFFYINLADFLDYDVLFSFRISSFLLLLCVISNIASVPHTAEVPCFLLLMLISISIPSIILRVTSLFRSLIIFIYFVYNFHILTHRYFASIIIIILFSYFCITRSSALLTFPRQMFAFQLFVSPVSGYSTICGDQRSLHTGYALYSKYPRIEEQAHTGILANYARTVIKNYDCNIFEKQFYVNNKNTLKNKTYIV